MAGLEVRKGDKTWVVFVQAICVAVFVCSMAQLQFVYYE